MLDVTSPLAVDVHAGLTRQPKMLPPKWLYDEVGSRLFDEITRLPEYYPTETERAILHAHAHEIAALSGASTVVELGSGTSDKTTTLLDAFAALGQLHTFVPVDVSVEILAEAAERLAARYPGLTVEPAIADFAREVPGAPAAGERRMIAFLGGTIGNFYPEERALFLEHVAGAMRPGDSFLLGTDLVKSADRLIAAYHDAEGVTERFILNVLNVLNSRLGADFDVDSFEYIPFWDAPNERMDLRVRSTREQVVSIPGAGLVVPFGEGEEIRVEISAKFRLERLAVELRSAGLEPAHTFTDADGDFALTLATRVPG